MISQTGLEIHKHQENFVWYHVIPVPYDGFQVNSLYATDTKITLHTVFSRFLDL